MKFRKKPVVIEAFQLTNENRFTPHEWPEWFIARFHDGYVEGLRENLLIRTLEGDMTACPNDWIIRGVKGELYPCKPDIFEATYERVEQ